MAFIEKEYSDSYAYDISKNVMTKGELWNDDVIKQSIEMIIGTITGERLFNFRFGCYLWADLFDNMTEAKGEKMESGTYRVTARSSRTKFERTITITD